MKISFFKVDYFVSFFIFLGGCLVDLEPGTLDVGGLFKPDNFVFGASKINQNFYIIKIQDLIFDHKC